MSDCGDRAYTRSALLYYYVNCMTKPDFRTASTHFPSSSICYHTLPLIFPSLFHTFSNSFHLPPYASIFLHPTPHNSHTLHPFSIHFPHIFHFIPSATLRFHFPSSNSTHLPYASPIFYSSSTHFPFHSISFHILPSATIRYYKLPCSFIQSHTSPIPFAQIPSNSHPTPNPVSQQRFPQLAHRPQHMILHRTRRNR